MIYDSKSESSLDQFIKAHKYTCYKGISTHILEAIKTLDYGLHLLESAQSRGIDIRYKVDSIVLIIAETKNYHELIQMVGRSSRVRGVCESVLFTTTNENSSCLFKRLQREGINEIGELEKLV